MNYNISLDHSFISYYSFIKKYSSSGVSLIYPNDQPVPDFSGASSKPAPFFVGSILHCPVYIGTGTGAAGTIGFFSAKVHNNLNLVDTEYRALASPEDFVKAQIKLSAQSIKMLKTSPANRKVFEQDSGWSSRGFKCKPEEMVKCMALDYLSLVDSRSMIDNLAYTDYNLGMSVADKKVSNSVAFARTVKHFQTQDIGGYMLRSLGGKLAPSIVRTAKEIDDSCVLKWRRPSSSSKWPWTMDHHWFNSQESAVATAYYTMSSLMQRNSDNKGQLLSNLPVFSNIRQLETSRKALEYYFINLKQILKPHSNQLSIFSNMVSDLDWPGSSRYSASKKPTPEMFPIKACMALGVLPLFDQSGEFVKFTPINGKLHDNQVKLYMEIDPSMLAGRRPEVGLLLAYSVGIISQSALEALLGPLSLTGPKLAADPLMVQLNLGPNVVCCLPMDCANLNTYMNLRKFGINHDCRCNTEFKAAPLLPQNIVDVSAVDPYDLDHELSL